MTIDSKRVRDLFLAALEISNTTTRRELLDRECGQDTAMRQRVEAMLSAHDATGGFEASGNAIEPPAAAYAGAMLAGRYKLIEPIGEGGMGAVWLAEQKQPVKRKVAIKLIKPGMDSRQVLARFEAERQALALMDHPNIAKVFDGGVTDEGRPFFVMEFVKGVPFTEYCDDARLSLEERLHLFIPVCHAVQHAHQKGIIHRDLKPSNILISLNDGKPVPKVIDFGLAKAMHQSLTEQSLYTAMGIMVGTPLYMSPEQAEHNNLDVDTRTDIYSLGVILYELLSGTTPLERKQLEVAAYNEILRLIKEVDPPKPSTRLSRSTSLPSVAAQRSIEPRQLSKSLAGDLDWIVMKAMEKDRSRRYETANGLVRDIERFLNDEAVEACPPGTSYLLKKFLRRNKGPVVATALILLALVAGTAAVLLVQARANSRLRVVNNLLDQQRIRSEERERQAIDAVKRFGDVVSKNDKLKNDPALVELRKTLLAEPLAFFRKMRDQLQGNQDTRPESLARLAEAAAELGDLSDEIGDQQDALRAYQESLAIRDQLAREYPDVTDFQNDLARTLGNVGVLQDRTGQLAESRTSHMRRLAIMEQLARENPTVLGFQSSLAASHNNIGHLLSANGQTVEALASYTRGLEIRERLALENPTVTDFQNDLASSYSNIGILQRATGQPAEAMSSYERALEIRERLVQANPDDIDFQSDLATSHLNIGNLLRATGQKDAALSSHIRAREIQERLAVEHPAVTDFQSALAKSHVNIGNLQSETGQETEAMKSYSRAREIQERLMAENPAVTTYQHDLATTHTNIGRLHNATGQTSEALASYSRSREIRERLARENPTVIDFQDDLSSSHRNIGNLLRTTGQTDAAMESFTRAREIQERLAREHPELSDLASELGGTLNNMALIDRDAGHFAEARKKLLEAIESQRKALAVNPEDPGYRRYLKTHLKNLIEVCKSLDDTDGVADAERQLAEFRANNPKFEALDDRLSAIAGGEAARDNAERLELAQRAYDTKRFVLAARLLADALTSDSSLAGDRQKQVRYDAACCVALAASAAGDDEDSQLDDAARAQLRKKALDWLAAEMETWTALLDSDAPEAKALVSRTMAHWQQDADLASLRDDGELARLPAGERDAFRQIWTRAAELQEKSRN